MSDESSAFMEDLSPEHFMGEALKEARRAYEVEEVPVGAVILDAVSYTHLTLPTILLV